MQITISLNDTRFDDMGFTDAEKRDLIAQMFGKGVYHPDEYTSDLSITVEPNPADPTNDNNPADVAV